MVLVDRVVRVEQQEEVLARLREEEGLLPVLQALVQHVVDGRVAAVGPGVVLQAEEDVSADVEVERVLGGLVQEVRGLHKLGPERVEADVGGVQLPVVPLGQAAVSLPDGVVQRVVADGFFKVTVEDLGKRESWNLKYSFRNQIFVFNLYFASEILKDFLSFLYLPGGQGKRLAVSQSSCSPCHPWPCPR